MGLAGFVPFLTCYHGIGSLMHDLNGSISSSKELQVDFTGGNGYVEKDWGR
jgi:tocopherol cyclase